MRPGMFDNDPARSRARVRRDAPAPRRARADLPDVHLSSEHCFDDIVFARLVAGEGLPYPDARRATRTPRRRRRTRRARRASAAAFPPQHQRASSTSGAPGSVRCSPIRSATSRSGRTTLPRSAPRRRRVPPARRLLARRQVRSRLAEGGGEAPRRRGLRGRVLRRAPAGGHRRGGRRPSTALEERVGTGESRAPAPRRPARHSGSEPSPLEPRQRGRDQWLACEPDGLMSERSPIIGLGYVGLPVALAFARKFPGTVGFDIHARRSTSSPRLRPQPRGLRGGAQGDDARRSRATRDDLRRRTFFVVAVPTPVDENNVPDLTPVVKRVARRSARRLKKGDVVVYESTVYPGVTEEICGPILAKVSGLKQGKDFKLGYSPERINPGDKEHTLERITKVVSGEDAETLERVAARLRRDHRRRRPPRAVDQGRRGREGHREHAARPQHRADERARDHLRSHGHPHRATCSRPPARSGTSSSSARPGRRPLHRRRPVLPDDEGAAARLPARGDPRRPPHQQQRRAVRRAAAGEDAHRRATSR